MILYRPQKARGIRGIQCSWNRRFLVLRARSPRCLHRWETDDLVEERGSRRRGQGRFVLRMALWKVAGLGRFVSPMALWRLVAEEIVGFEGLWLLRRLQVVVG